MQLGRHNSGSIKKRLEMYILSIISASLDYKSAAIDIRERFSYTSTRIREILRRIKAADGVSGAVLLCTCNRTELYISGDNIENMNPALLLCQLSGEEDHKSLMTLFSIRHDSEAIFHLMEVACGLQSMVLFEDQIITQVKNAAAISREEKTIDSTLETLFRLCITAAKKAKTEIKVKAVPTSAAERAITELSKKYCFTDKRILVIGNGEIGRLCCKKLIELGAEITITLRKYKHGEIIIPVGCNTIPYDEREEVLPLSDVVISATTSPHFTITYDMIEKLERKPEIFVDLALPRDIESSISNFTGVELYNLDRFYTDYSVLNQKEVSKIREIINHFILQFEKWKDYREEAAFTKIPDLHNDTLYGRFPLFIDLSGKKVLVVGGGEIATRRVKTLLRFGADIYLVAPHLTSELQEMLNCKLINYREGYYESQDIQNMFLVIAATNDRETNHKVYLDAKEKGIQMSIADCREECSFYFPAIFEFDGIVGGLVSQNGDNHSLVKSVAEQIRKIGQATD